MNNKKILAVILTLLSIVAFSFLIHGRLEKIADADSFYHIKHSWLYRTTGFFQTSFPWVQYSVINKYSADIWYGFHILLTPLTYFNDLLRGIKLGEFLTTIFSLLLVFWALKNLKIKWPLFWVFIFALSSADVLYRISMLRPHPLSLGIALLIFSFLARPSRYSHLFIFLASTLFSWLHLSLSWLPVLILLVVILLEILQKQGLDVKKIIAVSAGLFLGLILRPNPLGAAKLAYVQVVQLLFEKQADLPLRFGRELSPFYIENFVDQLIPITVLLIIAVGLLWQGIPKEAKTAIVGGLMLCLIFAVLTFAVARRSNDIFIGFGTIFLGLVFTRLLPALNKKGWPLNLIIITSTILLLYMPVKTIYRFDTFAANAFEPRQFQDLSLWLKENSKPGEIVFNIHWDRFAQLFFWNHNNYYINGMDPIFQYANDPSLYWKTHFFSVDAATAFTCGQIRCTAEEVENTPQVLKKDFRASYIIMEKRRYPKLFKYLEAAKEFRKVFENDGEVLYKI